MGEHRACLLLQDGSELYVRIRELSLVLGYGDRRFVFTGEERMGGWSLYREVGPEDEQAPG